jgi:hypothetical protein
VEAASRRFQVPCCDSRAANLCRTTPYRDRTCSFARFQAIVARRTGRAGSPSAWVVNQKEFCNGLRIMERAKRKELTASATGRPVRFCTARAVWPAAVWRGCRTAESIVATSRIASANRTFPRASAWTARSGCKREVPVAAAAAGNKNG